MSTHESAKASDGAGSVDFMSLLGRCLGNFKIVERAITTFRDAGSSDIQQLQEALDNRDYAAVSEIAHRFKGAASNVSAVGIAALLLQAEQFGKDGDHDQLTLIIEQLWAAWDDFQRVVQALAPSAGSSSRAPLVPPHSILETRHAGAGR